MSDENPPEKDESNKLLTLEQARDLFPGDDPPSMRWISKMAQTVGCSVRCGRRVYVTADLTRRIAEYQAANPVKRGGPTQETMERRSMMERPAMPRRDSKSRVRELIAEVKRNKKRN